MTKDHEFIGTMNEDFVVVGKDLPRIDGISKATGKAEFTSDILLPGMLVGKILRSPHAHARILKVDTGRAEKLPGVKAVVTGYDHPGNGFGTVPGYTPFHDNQMLQRDKVRYIGDGVAAVAAIDEDTAMEALRLIDVEYEVLPAVFDSEEAYQPGAPQLHEYAARNVCSPTCLDHGDTDKGFQESDIIIGLTVETGKKQHGQLEPHVTVASYDIFSRKVTVWTSTQIIFKLRHYLAQFFGWPVSSINIVRTYCGGGFGGKTSLNVDAVASIMLSKKAGRPVKIAFSREEHFLTGLQKHPMKIALKAGFKKNGTIMALDTTVFSNTGAYADSGPIVLWATSCFLSLTYVLPSFRFDGKCMLTNTSVCTTHRGVGNQQGRFAFEQVMDMAADRLGMDPAEIRLINAVYPGYVTPNEWKITSCGLRECIEEAVRKSGYREKRGKMGNYRGIGLGCTGYGASGGKVFFNYDPAGAFIKLMEDGKVALLVGNAEIGQGSDTTVCQIVAEELGVHLEDIIHRPGDTETTPLDLGAFASRTTFIVGNAARKAAQDAKDQLLALVAEKFECNVQDLVMRDRKVYVRGNPGKSLSFAEAVSYAQHGRSRFIYGRGYYDSPDAMPDLQTGKGNVSPAYTFGAAVAEVEVDPETGKVKVLRITQSQDVGYPVNPIHCEAQIEGSTVGALGQILYEDYRYNKNGLMMNPSFMEYRLPAAGEAPEIDSILVITNDQEGPFGAKGMSESPEIPVIGAIANAISDAIGIRMDYMPITPGRILAALKRKAGDTMQDEKHRPIGSGTQKGDDNVRNV